VLILKVNYIDTTGGVGGGGPGSPLGGVGGSGPSLPGGGGMVGSSSGGASSVDQSRPLYPRTQYSISRAHVTIDPNSKYKQNGFW
jgi:hypothetical protein